MGRNLVNEINNALAEWDPIGMRLSDKRWPFSEYINYIPSIINAFLTDGSIYEFLIGLNLNMGVNDEILESTFQASHKITTILNDFSRSEIESTLKNWKDYISL
jgi:hypothetical protein